ncbi:hypothetical protein CHUAL_001705 [Chamberlinius hualienensis]
MMRATSGIIDRVSEKRICPRKHLEETKRRGKLSGVGEEEGGGATGNLLLTKRDGKVQISSTKHRKAPNLTKWVRPVDSKKLLLADDVRQGFECESKILKDLCDMLSNNRMGIHGWPALNWSMNTGKLIS